MLQQLRDVFARELAAHSSAVLCADLGGQVCQALVRYRAEGVELECLVPRWTELAYVLAQEPQVALSIALQGDGSRWLAYQGRATLLEAPRWQPAPPLSALVEQWELYVAVRITPRRIDLIDEARTWGIAETFEVG